MFYFFSVFYLKASLKHADPFRKELDGSLVSPLLLGSSRQCMAVCAKSISSWVRKVLGIADAHLRVLSKMLWYLQFT